MSPSCLTQLFLPGGLFVDDDGDGLPDGLTVRLSPGTNPGAIDVAARLGLETVALTPGFTARHSAPLTLWFGPENPECPAISVPDGCGKIALVPGGVVVTGSGRVEGWEAARWLAATYPFAQPDGQPLGDLSPGRAVHAVILRAGLVVEIIAGEAFLPLGLDKPTRQAAPTEPPFMAPCPGDLPPVGPARLFTVQGLLGSQDGVQPDRTAWQVMVSEEVTAVEIAALCELAARTGVESTGLAFPVAVAPGEVPLPQSVGPVSVRLTEQPPLGAIWAEAGLAWRPGELTVFGTPDERAAALSRAAVAGLIDGVHATLFTRRAALPEAVVPPGEVIFDIALQAEWEVDRFRRVWVQEVLPHLTAGDSVQVDLRISEPLAVREALAEEMAEGLQRSGVSAADMRVLSAYKQGFHWLEEEMLPVLKALGPLAHVTVTCAPFAGVHTQSEATLGSGVAPQSGSGGELRGPEGGKRNGETLEMVIRWLQELYPADELLAQQLGVPAHFSLAETAQTAIYVLTAYRPDGAVALQESFSPLSSARLYLPEFPYRGRVHPPTGGLRVTQGERLVVETGIDTDVEAVWSAYQAEVLPRLRQYLIDTFGPQPDPAGQPFFGSLIVEMALSEDDRRLGIREEQISPLDALHEDLYFYTLDYVNELGINLSGQPFPAPGAVEPWIRSGKGGPLAHIRLHGRAEQPLTLGPLPTCAADLPKPAPGIPLDRVIGPDQLPSHLAYLAQLPGVKVWRTGLSFAGRATWGLSVTAPTAGQIAPPQKLSAWRPTLLVNARRHANEVSSTNSILKLAELAATQGLGRSVNLVLSPMENVDGAAVHYAMQQEHPNWKLHAARFNAAGVDFGFDCFAPEPHFGEARTLPTLWRSFMPDVVLDDHGYPSHEWVQPFSGYSSAPYFRTSWWIPSALIYGIHRWMDAERFPANAMVQEAIREALADRLTNDEEIAGYTRTLLERYVTYGQRYVAEKFPLQRHRDFVSLTGAVAAGPDARSFVGRFPHITAAEVVTEVPDETAQGDYLALCARAHLEGDLAVLDLLARHRQPVERLRVQDGDRVFWVVGRVRPFHVGYISEPK